MQYLNGDGLEYLWQKIRDNFISDSLFARCHMIPLVKGTQTAATNLWTGQLAVDEVTDGMTILYYLPFAGTSTAATLTLTLNDGEFSAPVYIANSTCTTHIEVNSIVMMTYNSALNRWTILGDRDSNTTYSPQSLGFGYGTCTTEEATTAKVVTLASYGLVKNGMPAVKFTYAVPAGATMNINSKGAKPIYYQDAAITAGVIKAGDTATFVYDGTNYRLISIDRVSPEYTDASEVEY